MTKPHGPGEIRLRQAIKRRAEPQRQPTPLNTRDLFDDLCNHFSEEELKTFCFFTLALDYESLPGDGKRTKAREIIAHFLRADALDTLVDAIREQRPELKL